MTENVSIVCEFLGLKVRGLLEFINSKLKITLRILHRSAEYVNLQKSIILSSSPFLLPAGHLLPFIENSLDVLTGRRQMSTARLASR